MRFSLISLILLTFLNSHAQVLPDTIMPAEIFIRFNPTGLVDLSDLTISVGAERRMSPNVALAMDLAYIPYSYEFENAKRTVGFIARPAIRYFPSGKRFYLEGELHYKQVTHKIEDWVQRDVVDGVASFEQFAEFRYRKTSRGVHIKIGRLYKLSSDARFWCEFYLGAGFHITQYKTVNLPHSSYESTNAFGLNRNERVTQPAVPMGFRLMYRILPPH